MALLLLYLTLSYKAIPTPSDSIIYIANISVAPSVVVALILLCRLLAKQRLSLLLGTLT